MTQEQIARQQETRKQNASKRKEREERQAQELKLMRTRLIKALDNPTLTDSEAIRAVSLLWDISEKSRHYL